MARRLRLQYEGAIYHVMNRGEHQEPIFRGTQDRQIFLKTLGEACAKTDWQVHAWCLMGNRFHLVVETPKANLVDGMKWLLGTYTVLAQVEHRPKGEHFGAEIRESAVGKARGLLQHELERLGWKESELSERRKGDPNKLAIALRLRQEATMTLAWIAEQLHMDTKGYLSHLLYWHGRKQASA